MVSLGFSAMRRKLRASLTWAASRNLRPPYFTKGMFRRLSSTSRRVAVVGGAEEDGLFLEVDAGFEVVRAFADEVIGLLVFVDDGDELGVSGRSCGG